MDNKATLHTVETSIVIKVADIHSMYVNDMAKVLWSCPRAIVESIRDAKVARATWNRVEHLCLCIVHCNGPLVGAIAVRDVVRNVWVVSHLASC